MILSNFTVHKFSFLFLYYRVKSLLLIVSITLFLSAEKIQLSALQIYWEKFTLYEKTWINHKITNAVCQEAWIYFDQNSLLITNTFFIAADELLCITFTSLSIWEEASGKKTLTSKECANECDGYLLNEINTSIGHN